MVDVQWSKVKSSGRAASFPFFLDASHMRAAANKLIATTLVALLATLGCFEPVSYTHLTLPTIYSV